MERVADYVIERLVEAGVKHIFLLTGRGILYLTDAVAKNKEIKGVSTYHEQGASYAAMAYAAASGGMSACLVSTGCAATNAVTAALCAYQDNLPVIFISGQHMLIETTRYTNIPLRTYGSQEADIIRIVESITKYSAMLTDPNEIAREMDKMILTANSGRKGPVWLDIPLDLQNARIEANELERITECTAAQPIVQNVVSQVATAINDSERPVIFIGGGVRSANAVELFSALVEKTCIPVVFSTAAADAFGSGNELSIGAVGSIGGSRAGNFAIQNSDLVLAIGTKLSSQSIGDVAEFAREAKLIVVDIDEVEHSKKEPDIDLFVHADAREFIAELLKQNIARCTGSWVEKCKHWKAEFDVVHELFVKETISENKIDLYHFAAVLSDKAAANAMVITDAGLEELIIPSSMKFKQGQRCIFPSAQGAMGYAIPAIIGAYYSGRDNIIAVVGDGSFMMNMQELLLISAQKIPAKIFVINNNMYAVIRKRQKDLFRTRTIGNDPSDGVAAPDLEKIAAGFGIEYQCIMEEAVLFAGIEKALNAEGPLICEVKCVEDQKYLHTSFAFNDKRKLIKRPLEDLSPFLSRDVFNKEMIIEPIGE